MKFGRAILQEPTMESIGCEVLAVVHSLFIYLYVFGLQVDKDKEIFLSFNYLAAHKGAAKLNIEAIFDITFK